MAKAIPDAVLGHALCVYKQQASNLGPGVADIQVAHDLTSLHDTRLHNSFGIILKRWALSSAF